MTREESERIVKKLWASQKGTISERIAAALRQAYWQGQQDEGRAWHHSEICGTTCRCDKAYPPLGADIPSVGN